MSNDDMNTKPTIETVLDRINALAVHMDERFDSLENRVTSLENRVGSLENRMESLENRTESFEQRMEARMDSFEKRIEARMDSLEKRADASEERDAAIEKHIRRIDIRLDRIEGMVLTVRSSLDDLRDQLAERMPEIR